MPTDLDEPKATTTPDAGDSTIPAGGTDDTGGTPQDDTSSTPPDPLTAGLEEGLELAEDLRKAAAEPVATTKTETAPALPKGLTVDAEGRWRTADGKFAEKQPSEQAAASAKAETEKIARVADYKAKGLDANGNRPWTPNIYGTVKPIIPGAIESPGHGIFIPEAQRGALTALVARGEKWHEVQATRQEHAAALEREQQRTEFYAEAFKDIMQSTLLSPEWMERATKDEFTYETAKQQVENRLRAAMVDAKEKFGAITPKSAETATSAPPPDRYDAQQAIDSFLDEQYPGIDKAGVLAILSAKDGPEVLRHFPQHGWQLDERPMHLVARYIQAQKKTAPVPTPDTDPATTRNKAAVPTTPAKPAVTTAERPRATPTPEDPRTDPRYAGRQRDNPALSFDERREAYYKELGIRVPQ